MEVPMRVREWRNKFAQMQADRSIFNSHWDEIAKVVAPDSARFASDCNVAGEKHRSELYDSIGQACNERLAAGFYSTLTSPTQKWFELSTNNEELDNDYDVQTWLHDVSSRMFIEMSRPQCGFVTAIQEVYHSLGAFGNGIMFVTESPNLSLLQFNSLPLQECYFGESNGNSVDTLFRVYKRAALQLVNTFGKDKLSERTQKLAESGNISEKVEILHVIEPVQASNGKPFRSAYIEMQNNHIISEGSYDECPFAIGRFYKTSYETYGRGPGSTALADLNTLQQIAKTVLKGAQKMVDPPLMVPDQGFIGTIRVAPGAISYFRQGLSAEDRVQPLLTQGAPALGEDLAQSIRVRVREIFFNDQLQMTEGPQMTATEVLQRAEDRMRLLGPVVGRTQAELLGPMLERVFGLLLRAGRLPEPPESLLDPSVKLRIVYQSLMFKALEQTEANGLLRVAQLISPFMAADPTVMDVFNTEQIARQLGRAYSLNPAFFRSEREVESVRQQRQQQQQMQQQLEMAAQGGAALKDTAQGMAALGSMQ